MKGTVTETVTGPGGQTGMTGTEAETGAETGTETEIGIRIVTEIAGQTDIRRTAGQRRGKRAGLTGSAFETD